MLSYDRLGLSRLAILFFAFCGYLCRRKFALFSWAQRFQRLRILIRPSALDRARPSNKHRVVVLVVYRTVALSCGSEKKLGCLVVKKLDMAISGVTLLALTNVAERIVARGYSSKENTSAPKFSDNISVCFAQGEVSRHTVCTIHVGTVWRS